MIGNTISHYRILEKLGGGGMGVRLDREKVREYGEMYNCLGPYPYDQDPLRPGWTPTIPNTRWADPSDARERLDHYGRGRSVEN